MGVSTRVPSTPTVVTAPPVTVARIEGTATEWPSGSLKMVVIGSVIEGVPTAAQVVWSASTGGRFTSMKTVAMSHTLRSNGLHTRYSKLSRPPKPAGPA